MKWGLVGLLACTTGCAAFDSQGDATERELATLRREVAVRDQQIAAHRWHGAIVGMQLERQATEIASRQMTQAQVARVEELLTLNHELAGRLTAAEKALEELRNLDQSAGGPARFGELPQSELAKLRSLRLENEKRVEAHRRLVRNIQDLVDAGAVRIVIDSDGRARLYLPRDIDRQDPWR